MVAITPTADPTLVALDDAMEIEQNGKPRGHLGASMIGDKCHRKIWYSFRWVAAPHFDAATLRRFDDGHRSEDIMAARLRTVNGIELHTEAEDGKQYGFKDHGGHFAGSVDGVIRGLLQAPKTPHIWEHKCVGEKGFNKLQKLKETHGEKGALVEWNLTYYGQAQVYMHYFQLPRHYMTVNTAGSRDHTSVRTDYHQPHAESLINKAQAIIASDTPPTRITEQKDHWECKFCSFARQCHFAEAVSDNCRTCRHSEPVEGGWHCHKHNAPLGRNSQLMGCHEWEALDGFRGFGDR